MAAAQTAFERARDKYKVQLNPKELAYIEGFSSIDHLISQAQAKGAALQAYSTKRTFTFWNNAGEIAAKLRPFERLLEGVCKVSKGGDVIWGSVSFILEMAKNNANVFHEVLGFFVDIALEMEYLKTVEATFTNSTMVVSVVEALYVAIIAFWVKAVKYYRGRLKPGVLSGLKIILSSSNMADNLAHLKSEIATQKTRLHEVEAAQFHAQEAAHHRNDEKRIQVARQIKIVEWINAPQYERDFRAADKHRYRGTCEWLREKVEYINWKERLTSAFLVVYGIPGAGKTILSSWIVNEVLEVGSAQRLTLYHYFKENDDGKNTPLAATRSFLDQLYQFLISGGHELLPKFELDLEAVSRKNFTDFEPLWDVLDSFLTDLSQRSQPGVATPVVTIVLDAMDECKGSKQLVRRLRKLACAGSNIRVVATARKSGDHVDEFTRQQPNQPLPTFLEISQHDVEHDIASFVNYKISKINRLRHTKHDHLRTSIISSFSKVGNHQGMFLWATLMCKDVKHQLTISRIWNLLHNLPRGLDATYARICQRLAENDEQIRDFGRLVLWWIVASSRPMRFDELEEALKTMQARTEIESSVDPKGQFFDSDGDILWSRADIVKSCGDFVTYTGLEEGDLVGLVHLSARKFLCTLPSQLSLQHPGIALNTIEPFLVNVPRAELSMGTTCLEYLLNTSANSNQYLSLPISIHAKRTPKQEMFKRGHPFFDYAVVYSAEYVLNTVQAHSWLDTHDIEQLLSTFTRFTTSPVSIIWLEELIRLTYFEFAHYIIWRFTRLDAAHTPSPVSNWANLTMRVLVKFSQSLAHLPQMVRLCVSQLRSAATPDGYQPTNEDTQLLGVENKLSWMHYNARMDSLFFTTGASAVPKLKCQTMKTGMRLRAMLAVPEKRGSILHFLSASFNAREDYIAVTYKYETKLSMVYQTTCWNIDNLETPSSTHDWAKVVLSHRDTDERHLFSASPRGLHNIIAFGTDDTLITLSGVWSLKTQERISRPTNIYEPDAELNVTSTCFSGQGGRVARLVHGDAVEVLDISGTSICTHKVYRPGCSSQPVIRMSSFSDTGKKVIIKNYPTGAPQDDFLLCLLVDEKKEIEMAFPSHLTIQDCVRFTKEEDKFVASVHGLGVFGIAVWTFSRSEDGSYCDLTHMLYIYGSLETFTFDLTKQSSEYDVIIAERSGAINRRSINVEWSSGEKTNLSASLTRQVEQTMSLVTGHNPLELTTWSVYHDINLSDAHHRVISVEKWSFGAVEPEDISRAETSLPVSPKTVFSLSPAGDCLAFGTQVVEALKSPHGLFLGLDVYDIDNLPGKMLEAAFSFDGARLACIYVEGRHHVLSIFEVGRGKKFTRRADFPLQDLKLRDLVFSKRDPDLLAVDWKYVLKLDGNRLVVLAELDEPHVFTPEFSGCGLYLYHFTLTSPWPRLHLLQEPQASSATDITFPTSLELGRYYVHAPHILRLSRERSTGAVFLDHKTIDGEDGAYRSRVICVLPDTHTHTQIRSCIFLTWPDEDHESLKVSVVVEGASSTAAAAGGLPTVIDTGIKRGEVMQEGHWVENKDT